MDEAARRLARGLDIDEGRDVVTWTAGDGRRVETGLHDYAALYDVPGLYEAVFYERLGGGSPALLAGVLAEVVGAGAGARTVLDVGAGTGSVGSALWEVGFRRIWGTDIEPVSVTAIQRDRPGTYLGARACDLVDPSDGDRAWLDGLGADVVTVAGAVGFGHLPVAAFATLTDAVLAPGGLLAITVAQGFADEPDLAGHAALLRGPAYRERARRDGVHRRTADGGTLEVTALVLERAGRV